MGRHRAGATRDKVPGLEGERAPGSKVAKCRSNGVFPNAAFISHFELKWQSSIWNSWKGSHLEAK
jgi:hypothetical protein